MPTADVDIAYMLDQRDHIARRSCPWHLSFQVSGTGRWYPKRALDSLDTTTKWSRKNGETTWTITDAVRKIDERYWPFHIPTGYTELTRRAKIGKWMKTICWNPALHSFCNIHFCWSKKQIKKHAGWLFSTRFFFFLYCPSSRMASVSFLRPSSLGVVEAGRRLPAALGGQRFVGQEERIQTKRVGVWFNHAFPRSRFLSFPKFKKQHIFRMA